MSDGGFDFRTPPQRREPRRFEPPPWEREAFQKLDRERSQPEQQESVHTEAVLEPVVTVSPEPKPERSEASPGVSEAAMIEMLAGLAGEEPDLRMATRRVAFGSAIVLSAIGMVLMIWGVAAIVGLKDRGLVGVAGGAILEFFGIGFIGMAAWLVYRTLKRQGVL